jgi:hypothetical protein
LEVLIILRKKIGPKGEESCGEDEESCMMRSFIIYIFAQYYYGDHVSEDEIGATCSMPGANEKCMQNFSRKI